ncbi:MAG TPA: DNA cytosine methyltransferase [Nitrosopumilus sp.]|nr:DNA cytosine methyltransferase [Nitrosopumilus sp.]
MKLLDLFCGAGGASVGLKNAGFNEIIGIDINPMPEYPFKLNQIDALNTSIKEMEKADLIWASPPCQAYSHGTIKWRKKGKEYPDLIRETRRLLQATQKPFVIENVIGAPLRKDLMLCGEMFRLKIIRHRIFECHGFKPNQIPHKKHKNAVWNGTAIGVWGGGKPGCFGNKEKRAYYNTIVKQNKNNELKEWQNAMEIGWVNNKKTLSQCVPPKYAEYIGKEFLKTMVKV